MTILIRQENPLKTLLSSSTCFFTVRTKKELTRDYSSWIERGGEIFSQKSRSGEYLTFAIGHDQIDAFGGMFALASFFEGIELGDFEKDEKDHLIPISKNVSFKHYVVNARLSESAKTYTQRLISSVLKKYEDCSKLNIALAICMDPLQDMTMATAFGNSLTLASMRGDRLFNLANMPKSKWRSSLRLRGNRALELARTPHTTKEAPPPDLLFSSLGDVSNFSWFKGLQPDNFFMLPTPSHSRCMNIVTWSWKDQQALTIAMGADVPEVQASWAHNSWMEVLTDELH